MCPACGKTVGNTDKFCAACGAALTTAAAQPTPTPPGGDARTVQRHRLGGTAYMATLPDSTEAEDDATAEVHAILTMSTDPTRVSGTGSTRSRSRSGKRRMRRRHW